jgi:hypothetical protein
MIKLKKLLKESSPGFTKNEANASVIRKKLLKKFGEDPLYREFILAKTPKEQKKALKTLKSIRGGNAVRLMQKYVKKLQGESMREFGDTLPTFKGVMEKHQQIQEARFRGANGQGINAKVSKVGPRDGGVEGNPLVDYSPKDWGVLLTRELLEAMAEKLGDFTLSTSAGLELGKSDVKMIKGTKHGLWKHKGNEVTIEYWASYS